jgi:hypothetical protein
MNKKINIEKYLFASLFAWPFFVIICGEIEKIISYEFVYFLTSLITPIFASILILIALKNLNKCQKFLKWLSIIILFLTFCTQLSNFASSFEVGSYIFSQSLKSLLVWFDIILIFFSLIYLSFFDKRLIRENK